MTDPAAPTLEMLWEPDDPSTALAARFGFGGATAAGRWFAEVLRTQWEFGTAGCERIVLSDLNMLAWLTADSRRFVAKCCVEEQRFPRLQALPRLTHWLDAQGIPVSAPVPTADGRLQVEIDGYSLGLQDQVEGQLLDTVDDRQVRAAGGVLARLHHVLAEHPDAAPFLADRARPRSLAQRITAWLEHGADQAPSTAAECLRRLMADPLAEPEPMQPLHSDIRSANVIMRAAEVAALLDFEQARIDYPIVEVARSAVLLGTRFHDWGPTDAGVHDVLRAGYESIRPFTAAEADWWPILRLWHTMVMIPAGDDPTGWAAAAAELASTV